MCEVHRMMVQYINHLSVLLFNIIFSSHTLFQANNSTSQHFFKRKRLSTRPFEKHIAQHNSKRQKFRQRQCKPHSLHAQEFGQQQKGREQEHHTAQQGEDC